MLVSIDEGTGDGVREASISVQVDKIQKFANEAQSLVKSADNVIDTISDQDGVVERERLSLSKNLHDVKGKLYRCHFDIASFVHQPFSETGRALRKYRGSGTAF
jgi:hypothetical protein